MLDENLSYLNQNKIFAHLDRVSGWLKKGISKPIMMEIDPTNVCNHNCPGCAGNRYAPQVSLSLDFMKRIFDETSPFLKSVVFTGGGEPLVNKDTIEAVLYAKRQGLDVGFITNGTLITNEIAEKLVKNCVWVRVSLDADNSKYYSKVHGVSEFFYEKTLTNIAILVDSKKKLNSKCTVGVGYLTNNYSSKVYALSFAKKMKNIGVDYVQFRPFHFDRTDVSEEIKECKKLENSRFKIVVSKHRYDKITYNYPEEFRDEFTTVIGADGKLYPCCFTRGKKEFELGDLYNQSFEEIWNSKQRKDILRNKLKMKTCPPMCKQDKLSQTLWEIKKIKEKSVHVNFI